MSFFNALVTADLDVGESIISKVDLRLPLVLSPGNRIRPFRRVYVCWTLFSSALLGMSLACLIA